MSKKFAVKLSIIIILLTAINSCYYERETDQLKVCFARNYSIWTMNIDGSEQREITSGLYNSSPSWSPDGKKILFQKTSGSYENIYVINSDGSGLKQITHNTGTDSSKYLTWSADGEKIIFTGIMNSKYYVFIANKNGIIQDKIEYNNQLTYAAMSPDGNDIYALDNNNKFYVFNLKSRLTTFSKQTDYSSFSISPDGVTLACFNQDTNYIDFWNISTDTSVQLIEGSDPCWTPDGKKIVYVDNNNIYSINIDGTNQKPLTTDRSYLSPCVKWKPR